MAIEFRCPSGHRLSCPDDRAGRSGKCPKCGALFRVPEPGMPPEAVSDSGVSQPEITDGGEEPVVGTSTSGIGQNPAEAADDAAAHDAAGASASESSTGADGAAKATPAGERIVFLCPNGHKLNCPASMQGRPGKCPHCGATFLVPQYEPEEDELDAPEEFEPDADDANDEDLLGEEEIPVAEPQGTAFNGGAYDADAFPFDFNSIAGDAAEVPAGHSIAALFQRLWAHRRSGAIVELYLKGGEVLAPEWYSERSSQETCGMFAFPDTDGSFTLTAVNWDAVERIAVRGVPSLPEGMFDEP